MTAVKYLVSGDRDIHACHKNLEKSGRHVLHGNAVGDAETALAAGAPFVVIAHGSEDGTTVFWCRDPAAASKPWLFVGMTNPPKQARVYLYCCHAGKGLPAFLADCEVFGHVDEVPAPMGPAKRIVLDYFAQVERVLAAVFDLSEWRRVLIDYVDQLFATEVLRPASSSSTNTVVLAMLMKSLGSHS